MMRERNRRYLCRLVFVAVCVVPTFVTACCAALRMSPVYTAWELHRWEQSLYHMTGLVAHIDHIEHPSNGSILLVGVQVADPDGGDVVAKLRQAEIAHSPDGTLVVLSQPEIAQGKFLRLWEILHHRVLRGRPPSSTVQVLAGELTLEIGQHAQSFTAVRCTFEPRETGVRAFVDFQLAGTEMPSPAQLQIERNRQTIPPTTRWQLHSSAPIPCSLFADYLPALAHLGSRSVFQGDVAMAELSGSWTGQLAGTLSSVDLDIVTDSFPHKLSGQANVHIHSAVVREGALAEAAGHVSSPGGTISVSLLNSLAEHLKLAIPVPPIRLQQTYVGYNEMAFDFTLSPDGIYLAGQCSGESPGTLIRSSEGDLLASNPRVLYPLVAVVRSLSPPSQLQVPVTAETKGLISVLAFPTTPRAPATVAERPRARLRREGE